METKKKVFAGIAIATIVVVGMISFGMCFFSGSGSTYYYTRIDNSKIEQNDSKGGVINLSGGLEYSYTLPAYNENGKEKDVRFGASRELREGAFLRLTVTPVRGVLEWSEVQYEELPAAVQGNYADAVTE